MNELPNLPPNFTWDSNPQEAALPSLPPNFTWDAATQAQPTGVGGNIMDAIKGIPRNLLAGVMDAATTGAQAEAHSMSQPDLASSIPNTEQALKAMEPVTGSLYEPQGTFGKVVGSGARTLTNPASYVGPGGPLLKMGANALSGMGSEAAGQATQGSPYEGAARLGGALVGGVTGAKTLGPAAEKAAIPTLTQLKASAEKGYIAARNSGLELDPKGLGQFATQAQQELTVGPKYAFTGGQKGMHGGVEGTAPKTMALLDELQNAPEGATITASNLDTLRRQIGNIAGETKDFKPTADAKAAMVLKRNFEGYLENIPQDHIVAGNPDAFTSAIRQANGDWAAASRLGTFDARIAKAGNQTDRQIAGSLDARIKSNVGSVLDNPKQMRGLSQAEKDQIQLINSGTLGSNVLRQLGRGGAGVIPMGTHLGAAVASGGATIPASLGIGIPLYAARKISEGMTVKRAKELADLLAKRSPLYESRAASIQPYSSAPNWAAIARGPILGMR